MPPCRTLQLLALCAVLTCATACNNGCSNAAVDADREQQKIESSPEAKRKKREAAQKGVEGTTKALQGMEDAFGAGSQPQPDAQQQSDKPPEETPQ